MLEPSEAQVGTLQTSITLMLMVTYPTTHFIPHVLWGQEHKLCGCFLASSNTISSCSSYPIKV